MAMSMASFCISSFISALLMMNFFPAAVVSDEPDIDFRSSEEDFRSSERDLGSRAPPPNILLASSLILGFNYLIEISKGGDCERLKWSIFWEKKEKKLESKVGLNQTEKEGIWWVCWMCGVSDCLTWHQRKDTIISNFITIFFGLLVFSRRLFFVFFFFSFLRKQSKTWIKPLISELY